MASKRGPYKELKEEKESPPALGSTGTYPGDGQLRPDNNWPICASNADRNRDGATTSAAWRQSRRAMGKGGTVFYFWGADSTEKGSFSPNTVVNSNKI